MKATKPEKHLLLPVRSSNIRNHIVNLPATLLLRGGFVIYPRCSRIINSLLHVIILSLVAFRPPLAVFFVLHSLFFVFCLLLFIHRLSLFFCRFLFHVCLLCMYFCRLFFLFCLFPFFVYNKYSFCWKSKKVENFLLLQNKRNCLFGKEKDL